MSIIAFDEHRLLLHESRMSRGDFGYGSQRQPYHDDPNHADYRANPFNRGNTAQTPQVAAPTASRGYQGSDYTNVNELNDTISSNIFTINNNATTLERAIKQIGTDKDSVQLRDRVHDTEKSTNHIINDTVQLLRQLASLCKRAERVQKLQHERLTGEFSETIKRYNTFQKKVAEKVKSSVILTSQNKQTGKLVDWDDDGDEEQRLVDNEERRAQLLAQEEAIDTEVALLQEREGHIHQLESDILDINEIFRDLGTLVHEQGAVIDTIESNVESAQGYVEDGADQLQRAATYQRKARKKMCCLVGILLVVGAVVALIIVLSIKH